MTDDDMHHPEWTETDDRWSDAESNELPMTAVLYDGFECPDCGEAVHLREFDPDPDGPSWHGECCGNTYGAYPASVEITKSDAEL